MNMDSVRSIAAKYGMDLKGLKINILKNKAGLFGVTKNAAGFDLRRDAFKNEETLARTLAHENFHVGQIADGGAVPTSQAELDAWENAAYDHEDQWWASHPLNQGGAK